MKDRPHFLECFKLEHLSDEEITRIRHRDDHNPTEKMKCFTSCYFENSGYIKDGIIQEKIIFANLAPKYGEESVHIGIDRCKKVVGDDRCDLSFKLYECFQKTKEDLLS